ncbi:MAG: hypothetical protein BZY87_00455 [SAR202 cluster bacterium Io17-Chloro-G6]|nr:MAG: hypothetical protein BZY87_00455 [SAR202 cluster bacterium Io17-Chloro-G6]
MRVPPVDPAGAGAITAVGVGAGNPLVPAAPEDGVTLDEEQPMANRAAPVINSRGNCRFAEDNSMVPPSWSSHPPWPMEDPEVQLFSRL